MNLISNPSKALKAAVTGCFGLCLAAVLSNCNQADPSVTAPDKPDALISLEAEPATRAQIRRESLSTEILRSLT